FVTEHPQDWIDVPKGHRVVFLVATPRQNIVATTEAWRHYYNLPDRKETVRLTTHWSDRPAIKAGELDEIRSLKTLPAVLREEAKVALLRRLQNKYQQETITV